MFLPLTKNWNSSNTKKKKMYPETPVANKGEKICPKISVTIYMYRNS